MTKNEATYNSENKQTAQLRGGQELDRQGVGKDSRRSSDGAKSRLLPASESFVLLQCTE